MRRRNNKSKLVALILCIVLIGIGYAYLTTNLKIKGTTNIGNAKWDVHFENAKARDVADTVTFPSNSNSNVEEGEPVIVGEARQEIEWTAIFNAPGDYYSFDADVVNDGDIDAQLDYRNSFVKLKVGNDEELRVSFDKILTYSETIDNRTYNSSTDEYEYYKPEGLPEYLNYRINYDGIDLSAGNTGYIYCEVLIDKDKITNEEWTNLQGKEIKMSVDLKFVQDDGSPRYRPNILFENPVVNSNGTNTSVVPTITNVKEDYLSRHNLSYDVVFNNPGDYYEFTVDIKNYAGWAGYVNIEESYFTIGDGQKTSLYDDFYMSYYMNGAPVNNLPEGLVYSVNKYEPNYVVCQYDTRKVTVRIGLDPNISEANLNVLKGKHIKLEYNFSSDEGGSSFVIGRCPANHDWY